MRLGIELDLIDKMVAGGATAGTIAAYVRQHVEAYEAWRASMRCGEAEKKRRQRSRDTKGTPRGQAGDTRGTTDQFETFWKEYPKRKGDNPKSPARKVFDMHVKQGVNPDSIISGLRVAKSKNTEKIGTEFIPQAVKWLRDRRWEDYQPQVAIENGPIIPPEFAVKLFKDTGRWNMGFGPEPGQHGCRAAADILERYGFAQAVARETGEAA